MHRATIIGHRGDKGHRENTLPSFELALENGAHGVELDVRRSGDGQLVVIHDSVIGKHAVGTTDFDRFRDLGDGYEVPLFEDVLKKLSGRAFLDIELKEVGYETAAVELIKRHGDVANSMISGFHTRMLNKVHELLPDMQLGFIFNRTQDQEKRYNSPVDFVIPQFRLASRKFIEEVHDEGMRVVAWTVNSEREMRRLLALGIDGIITDEPGTLREVLAG